MAKAGRPSSEASPTSALNLLASALPGVDAAYRHLVSYRRGWAAIYSVTGGLPGDSVRVENTFASGPAHALEAGTQVAVCDPAIQIVDSTIREGWPPTLGDVCPDCLSMTQGTS